MTKIPVYGNNRRAYWSQAAYTLRESIHEFHFWQLVSRYWIIPLVAVIAAFYYGLRLAYNQTWTGFGTTSPSGKSLWDWLDLIGVPVVLAILGWSLNRQFQWREAQRLKDEARTHALSDYLRQMSALLLEQAWGTENAPGAADVVARSYTVNALHLLDGTRNRLVIDFLRKTYLIEKRLSILDLSGEKLDSVDLSEADLEGFNLAVVNFYRANLRSAGLQLTRMAHCNLREADLVGAYLFAADLQAATLDRADFRRAYLYRADLRKVEASDTNFRNAYLVAADLSDALFERADFRGADLSNVILTQQTRFVDVLWDNTTQWPEQVELIEA